jgi:intein-encoded DNA endonuclease-like protein
MSYTEEIFDDIEFEDYKVGSDTKDYNFIKSFNQQIENISLETTVNFLNTFSRSSDNVEYLEIRNKTLLKLWQHTLKFI